MNCPQARADLHERIDGSLGVQEAADLEDHLARCGSCRSAQAGLESALAILRDAPRLRTPASFEDQVLDRVRAERASARRLLPLHAAAVALAALAGTWLAMPRSRPDPAPADVSLAAPVRNTARPLVEASPAPPEPRAAVSPAAREEAPAAPRIDWEGAGREGIRLVAAAADLLASLARAAPAERPAPQPPRPRAGDTPPPRP
ncbi:MAG: zf-HC2 domain-containing protein, partial [Planctomycetes bacterium]|nr:zf-HC2 domain-containing protein [Planctomycetota bacterium]